MTNEPTHPTDPKTRPHAAAEAADSSNAKNAEPSSSVPATPVHAAEIWISNVLRVGVWLSLLIIVSGTVVTFTRHPDYRHSPMNLAHLTDPGDAAPHRITDVIDGLKNGQGRAIVELGLLTLIATPVVRVAASVIAFTMMRDRRFVVITLVVLTLLLVSFWLGKAEG